jgi:hypothetical protein
MRQHAGHRPTIVSTERVVCSLELPPLLVAHRLRKEAQGLNYDSNLHRRNSL